jgi:hypothetical protein
MRQSEWQTVEPQARTVLAGWVMGEKMVEAKQLLIEWQMML